MRAGVPPEARAPGGPHRQPGEREQFDPFGFGDGGDGGHGEEMTQRRGSRRWSCG